jgi:hypothetical protein
MSLILNKDFFVIFFAILSYSVSPRRASTERPNPESSEVHTQRKNGRLNYKTPLQFLRDSGIVDSGYPSNLSHI